ncbi:MAG: A24 family peptidase [Nanoarchaeota archaeon]|nr:A24 family peptidase [Nanoarchaeota archaeon]MBU1622887.1 A24 family peptidase [Nanoarchaeota archaeon]
MFWETISVVTILTLFIASYTDLKTREVPDWLNFGLIFSALGVRLIFSVELGWNIFLSGVLGLIVCVGLAYLFYFTNQWGGGDSKLLMGMGAVIGITYPFDNSSFNLLWFVLALLLLGSIYGLLWMFFIAIKKRIIFLHEFKARLTEYKTIHLILGIITLVFASLIFIIPLVWPLVLFPLGVFYLFLFVEIVEKNCFMKNVSVKDLTEGDWLAEDIKDGQKLLIKKKTLEEKDIWKLKKLHTESKIKEVLIKEGIPFIPSFLFAYLFLVFGKPLLGLIVPWLFLT